MVAEPIPDYDPVHRQIDYPRTFTEEREFIWEQIFMFPKNEGESVVWSRYAATAADVHRIGCDREDHARSKKPEFRYEGYISRRADSVRAIQSTRGHGFAVVHVPEEGMWHAEIRYAPRQGATLSKSDKTELKVKLAAGWSDLQPHNCKRAA